MRRFKDPPEEPEMPCESCYYASDEDGSCTLSVPKVEREDVYNLNFCPFYGVVKDCQREDCWRGVMRFLGDVPEEHIGHDGWQDVYCCSKECADEVTKSGEEFVKEMVGE